MGFFWKNREKWQLVVRDDLADFIIGRGIGVKYRTNGYWIGRCTGDISKSSGFC